MCDISRANEEKPFFLVVESKPSDWIWRIGMTYFPVEMGSQSTQFSEKRRGFGYHYIVWIKLCSRMIKRLVANLGGGMLLAPSSMLNSTPRVLMKFFYGTDLGLLAAGFWMWAIFQCQWFHTTHFHMVFLHFISCNVIYMYTHRKLSCLPKRNNTKCCSRRQAPMRATQLPNAPASSAREPQTYLLYEPQYPQDSNLLCIRDAEVPRVVVYTQQLQAADSKITEKGVSHTPVPGNNCTCTRGSERGALHTPALGKGCTHQQGAERGVWHTPTLAIDTQGAESGVWHAPTLAIDTQGAESGVWHTPTQGDRYTGCREWRLTHTNSGR